MKNSISRFSVVIIAFVALSLLMSYTRPAADEPKQYILVRSIGDSEDNFATMVNKKLSEGVASSGWYFANKKWLLPGYGKVGEYKLTSLSVDISPLFEKKRGETFWVIAVSCFALSLKAMKYNSLR